MDWRDTQHDGGCATFPFKAYTGNKQNPQPMVTGTGFWWLKIFIPIPMQNTTLMQDRAEDVALNMDQDEGKDSGSEDSDDGDKDNGVSLSPLSRLAVFDVTVPCDRLGIPVHLQAHVFSLRLPKKDMVACEC